MKISNPKTEVPSSCDLNDKDYMTRCLTYLKDIEKNYAVALTEASNETLYSKYLDQFKVISQMQRDIYEVMFNNGWYELQTASFSDITTKYNTLSKEFEDFN